MLTHLQPLVTFGVFVAASFSLAGDTTTIIPHNGVNDIYVDCRAGRDANAGSEAAPLRSVRAATENALPAGTTVWLARDCSWEGPMSIKGDGSATAPVALAAYGTGPAPELTGASLAKDQSVLRLTGAHQIATGIHIAHAAGTAIAITGVHDTVTDAEVDHVGIGMRFSAAFGSARSVDVHDLHMVVNTPSGDDDYGAVGFEVEAHDVEITRSSCTNCRAASFDYGYDGGFVEIWNHGDRLSVRDNVGRNTEGVLEIGGDTADASARNVTLQGNAFWSAHGGIWIHGHDHFAIPVTELRVTGNTISNMSGSDNAVLGGDLTGLDFSSNTVRTSGQVSWSGAPAHHEYNVYLVAHPSSVGYSLGPTEKVGRW